MLNVNINLDECDVENNKVNKKVANKMVIICVSKRSNGVTNKI